MIYTYQKKLKGEKVGIVFGTFAPLHQGHLDVIMRAKKECDGGCIVIVDGRDGDRGGEKMPLKLRYRYVREFFADDDLVAVYPIDETEKNIPAYPNGWLPFLEVVKDIIRQGTKEKPEPVFYVSEQAYYDRLTKEGFEAVLMDRTLNPISATMIRDNPVKYWDKITFPFRRVFSTNILICGTASEGKTTLTKDLGKYFNAPYSHEYARDYMEQSYISEWDCDGSYGKVRELYDSEKEKFRPICQQLDSEVNMDFVRLVEYCWYNGSDAPSYYDATKDPFYQEL